MRGRKGEKSACLFTHMALLANQKCDFRRTVISWVGTRISRSSSSSHSLGSQPYTSLVFWRRSQCECEFFPCQSFPAVRFNVTHQDVLDLIVPTLDVVEHHVLCNVLAVLQLVHLVVRVRV